MAEQARVSLCSHEDSTETHRWWCYQDVFGNVIELSSDNRCNECHDDFRKRWTVIVPRNEAQHKSIFRHWLEHGVLPEGAKRTGV